LLQFFFHWDFRMGRRSYNELSGGCCENCPNLNKRGAYQGQGFEGASHERNATTPATPAATVGSAIGSADGVFRDTGCDAEHFSSDDELHAESGELAVVSAAGGSQSVFYSVRGFDVSGMLFVEHGAGCAGGGCFEIVGAAGDD
jgi:hypothetical protein